MKARRSEGLGEWPICFSRLGHEASQLLLVVDGQALDNPNYRA